MGEGPITHTLVYFSGVVDDNGMGGVFLKGAHGQDVMTDMEKLDASPDKTLVFGFGGSLKDKAKGVNHALSLIESRDARGELIVYGYSAGGINSLDLCRALMKKKVQVDLLVTVDASGRGEEVNRAVPMNVVRNRNYYQTQLITFSRAVGGPNSGTGVTNINCDERRFEALTTHTRHSQMQDLTRFDAIRDMRVHIRRRQFLRDG